MLKATLNANDSNTDISKYHKLQTLLKRKSNGFQSKKSRVLSKDHIQSFLKDAPDIKYLFTKVSLYRF